MDVFKQHAFDVVPLAGIAATACPGGLVQDSAYLQIKANLIDGLTAALKADRLDGVLLALHGSAASESLCDLEGDLLQAVRQVVGEDIPIVATLDLHAHITPQMIEHSDVLVAWETYPHRDAHETGMRGARQ